LPEGVTIRIFFDIHFFFFLFLEKKKETKKIQGSEIKAKNQ